jgi:hypothetical protein
MITNDGCPDVTIDHGRPILSDHHRLGIAEHADFA